MSTAVDTPARGCSTASWQAPRTSSPSGPTKGSPMSTAGYRPSPRVRHRRWWAAGTATALLAVSALVGGGSATPAAAAATSTFTKSAEQISTFNPFVAVYDSELYVIGAIYPSLDVVQPDGTAKPYLADSWSTSSDKLTWTFKIHKGLKWSDGQPLTAKDAAWTFTTIMTNKTAGTANGALLSNWASATAPDDSTLVIKTKKPQSNMLNISVPFTGIQILPEHAWQSKVAGKLADFRNTPQDGKVVGYGPYLLTAFTADQFTTITANKNFFLGAPKFGRIVFQYFKSSDTAVAALRSGEIDETGDTNATQFKALKNQAHLATYQLQATHWLAIAINPGAKDVQGRPLTSDTGNPILHDQQVRTAIAYGIDRQTLVTKVLGGLGSPGGSYLGPAYSEWKWTPPPSEKIGYDPAKANSILDSLGDKKGSDGYRRTPDGKELSFRYNIHGDEPNDAAVAEYVVGWMKDIGIKLTVHPLVGSSVSETFAKGDYDLSMDSWSIPADPTYLLSIQTCGTLPAASGEEGLTDTFFCDKEYDRLFALQQTQFDQKQRAQTIAKMQEILYKANDDIILFNDNGTSVVNTDKVKNYITGTPDSHGTLPLQNGFNQLVDAAPAGGSGSGDGSSHTGLIIGVVIVVVVLGGLGAVVAMRRRSTSDERA